MKLSTFRCTSHQRRNLKSIRSGHILVFWVILGLTMAQLHDESFPAHPSDILNGRRLTREYRLKQGVLKGLVLEPREGKGLDGVEIFLGIPYAAPPVDGMRFMPPGSATQWSDLKLATSFAPVCPQMLPDIKKEASLSAGRYNYLKRLMPFLRNQSEDCLYLNIYVPSSEGYSPGTKRKFPVMIFIHGESFEWNSGNPYDGTVLASYGQIIVVTINFRLGMLGFMKPSISEFTIGNFGLLDQIAALQWVKDNIAAFNGDPNAVTLAGHGTGAACVNYLMVSPVANGLFHRAILMSGSALSDWAITSNPIKFTLQVAQILNCPLTADDLATCLRKKSLSEIMAVRVSAPKFTTPFGPIIDGSVIPNEPAQVMGVYKNLFSKYELLYGSAEMESYHLLGAIALAHGMLESERDSLLRLYTQARFEYRPDLAMVATLKEYSSFEIEPGKSAADSNRDSLIDILSDARVTAPLVQTANYHSKANPKSFFYIFGHNSEAGEYAALSKSVHGEELAYMFGVPLGAAGNHFREEYSPQEKLFSEIIMTYWTNFARTGNPNYPRKKSFLTLGPKDWEKYNIPWPQYNPDNQSYIYFGTPPYISTHYRVRYMKYWNEELPKMLKNHTMPPMITYDGPSMKYAPPRTTQRPFRFGGPPPWLHPPTQRPTIDMAERRPLPPEPEKFGRFQPFSKPSTDSKPVREDPYEAIRKMEKPVRPVPPGLMDLPLKKIHVQRGNYPPILISPTNTEETSTEGPMEPFIISKSAMTINIVIGIGIAFLLVNIIALTIFYYKRTKSKARENRNNSGFNVGDIPDTEVNLYEKDVGSDAKNNGNSCSIFHILSSSNKTRPDGFYEPVKNHLFDEAKTPKSDDSGGFGQRFKLRRHTSNSTLDAHTKVRDWITHEIVQRCSPNVLRKNEDIKIDIKTTLENANHIPHAIGDEIYSKNIPKPNCKIGSLTGSLKSPTELIMSASTLDRKNKLNEQQSIDSSYKPESKKSSKQASSTKSSKVSHSTKSNKSKKSNEKSGSDGSLRKTTKPQKVSVAVDATPATRGGSVLKQQPIEFSKSLDYCCYIDDNIETSSPPLRRSQTMEDFIKKPSEDSVRQENTFKSTMNVKLSNPDQNAKPSEVIKIIHKHSASDPVHDLNYTQMFPYNLQSKQAGSFNTFSTLPPPVAFRNDVNVTSRNETFHKIPMTPEESILHMQRRNYPKVLPDFPKHNPNPSRAQKRLSLPPQNHLILLPSSEENSQPNSEVTTPTEMKSFLRNPPLPPPRISSTLGRRPYRMQRPTERGNVFFPQLPECPGSPTYIEMCSNTLPNSIRLNSKPSEVMELYAQVRPKPRNRVNMQELEMSDVSHSDQTESEDEVMSSQNSLYETIESQPRIIVRPDPIEPIKVNNCKIIIKPGTMPPHNAVKPTNIPRVHVRNESADNQTLNSLSKPVFKQLKNDLSLDSNDSEPSYRKRAADLKIHIPVHRPDAKGPPTDSELNKTIKKSENSGNTPTTPDKPQSSSSSQSKAKTENKDVSIKSNKGEKKSNKSNLNKSTSASKIPKTPTMSAKYSNNSKKEQLRVTQSPKMARGNSHSNNKNDSDNISKTSIPQPVIAKKHSKDTSEKENSASDSSNDTETSTGTVKKVK